MKEQKEKEYNPVEIEKYYPTGRMVAKLEIDGRTFFAYARLSRTVDVRDLTNPASTLIQY